MPIIVLLFLLIPSVCFGAVIKSDDFEDGTTNAWDFVSSSTFVEESAAKNGTYGLRINYANTSSGDVNNLVKWSNLTGYALDDFWITFWLKLDTSIDAGVYENRKIVYMFGAADTSSWDMLVKADGTSYPVDLLMASNCNGYSYFCTERTVSQIYGNTWYMIEVNFQLNTAGQANGNVYVYVDGAGSPTASFENVTIRNDTNTLNRISFGAQQEGDYPSPSWSEDRWFDDITISTTRLASDSTAPVITAFVIPATHADLSVPITTFTATDAFGVTGYCVTETNDSATCSWAGTAQTSFVFGSAGSKTLYAFARDAALNVSTVASDQVVITLPVANITNVVIGAGVSITNN